MSDSLRQLEERIRLARARASALAAPIPTQVGPYRIHELLGEGGMGYVYRATHETLGREVALKLIRSEHRFAGDARERFLREARIAARLDHPALCRVYEFGEHEGLPWFAMQLIEGESLDQRLCGARQAGRRSIAPGPELALLFAKIAEALDVAHRQGLIHRDVKPSNLVIRPDGEPVVLDFGVARDTSSFDRSLTASGQMIGTPLYLPPEQVNGQGARDDRRWDVYSTAVTLYECLCLERPFDGETASEIFEAILRNRPKRLRKLRPELPRTLELVVMTAMDAEPSRRYADCADLAADLRRAVAGESIKAQAPSLYLRTKRWTRANPVAATFLAVLTLATIATGTQWLRAETNLERFNLLTNHVKLAELRDDPAAQLLATPQNAGKLRSFLETRIAPFLAQRSRLVQARDALRARALPYDDEQRQQDRIKHPRKLRLLRAQAAQGKLTAYLEGLARKPTSEARRRQEAYVQRRLAKLQQEIARLQSDPGALRTHSFADSGDTYLHDGLERLLLAMERYERDDVHKLRAQLAWAQQVRQRSVAAYRKEWQAASQRLAHDPRFEGVKLPPQLGLAPLGRCPATGLEEFAYLRSGSLPRRPAADQPLNYELDAAIVFVLLPPARRAARAYIGSSADSSSPGSSSPDSKNERPDRDEFPQHRVELEAFFLAKHEMTQAQWSKLTAGQEPSKYHAGMLQGGRLLTLRNPVESISWNEANRVLTRHGLLLPTEVQWEYACRATTHSPWWPGRHVRDLQGCENLGDQAAGRINPSWLKQAELDDGAYVHAAVGSYRGNRFGLFDMHGNLREWCRDGKHPYTDPARPGDGLRLGTSLSDLKVTRGGAFDYSAAAARSARRDGWAPHSVSANQGLRAARRLRPAMKD